MSVHTLFVMGSWMIALLFVMSAIGKASNWAGTIQLMKAHNIPLPELGLTTQAGELVLESQSQIPLTIISTVTALRAKSNSRAPRPTRPTWTSSSRSHCCPLVRTSRGRSG
jgi:hypothetical protein